MHINFQRSKIMDCWSGDSILKINMTPKGVCANLVRHREPGHHEHFSTAECLRYVRVSLRPAAQARPPPEAVRPRSPPPPPPPAGEGDASTQS